MHLLVIPPNRSVEIRFRGQYPAFRTRNMQGVLRVDASENCYPLTVHLRQSVIEKGWGGVRRMGSDVGGQLTDVKGLVPDARVDFRILAPEEFSVEGHPLTIPPHRSGRPRIKVSVERARAQGAIEPFNRFFCEHQGCTVETAYAVRFCPEHMPPPEDLCGRPLDAGGSLVACTRPRHKIGTYTMPYCAACLVDLRVLEEEEGEGGAHKVRKPKARKGRR